jgi:F-type H+-transporting ATPase subunit epsilon
MPEASFTLKIVTPNEVFFEGMAVSVIAPGENGYFGILKDHAPFVSTIGKGTFTSRDASGATKNYHLEGGFLEVLSNRVLVLTDKIGTDGV